MPAGQPERQSHALPGECQKKSFRNQGPSSPVMGSPPDQSLSEWNDNESAKFANRAAPVGLCRRILVLEFTVCPVRPYLSVPGKKSSQGCTVSEGVRTMFV